MMEANAIMDARQKATFGAGCFWGVEVAFRNVKGVTNAAVGYLGGTLAPTVPRKAGLGELSCRMNNTA